jgi:hypothetical protein
MRMPRSPTRLKWLNTQLPKELKASKPVFAWRVDFTLKKRDHIISAVKRLVVKKTHKSGTSCIPNTIHEAHALDKVNGNTLWTDAVAKEMKNVRVAFDTKEGDVQAPVQCHGIFDVKMDGFAQKHRMVAGGHATKAPTAPTHASVASRESFRIVLTAAALNGLVVKAADVKNACLTGRTSV